MVEIMDTTNDHDAQYSAKTTSLSERFTVIQELLKQAPQVVYSSESFPNTLRIVGKVNCWPTCVLGAPMNSFCHREGLAHLSQIQDGDFFPNINDIVNIWKATRPNSVKIIGAECGNVEIACKLIQAIRGIGCQNISTTCADISLVDQIFHMLVKAGLTRMTLSVHRFSDREKRSLIPVIEKLKNLQQESVKFNRVLLASTVNDLPDMIDWVNANKYTLRLFSIIQTPTTPTLFVHEYIHWTSVVQMFANRIERIDVTEYIVSNRIRYKIKMMGGGVIEVNMPTVCLPNKLVVAGECRSCELQAICEEGYFGCGIRLGSDGRVYPCLLRPDLSFKVERR